MGIGRACACSYHCEGGAQRGGRDACVEVSAREQAQSRADRAASSVGEAPRTSSRCWIRCTSVFPSAAKPLTAIVAVSVLTEHRAQGTKVQPTSARARLRPSCLEMAPGRRGTSSELPFGRPSPRRPYPPSLSSWDSQAEHGRRVARLDRVALRLPRVRGDDGEGGRGDGEDLSGRGRRRNVGQRRGLLDSLREAREHAQNRRWRRRGRSGTWRAARKGSWEGGQEGRRTGGEWVVDGERPGRQLPALEEAIERAGEASCACTWTAGLPRPDSFSQDDVQACR